ncbi:hypothetical protein [Nocardia sp. NPDC056000]|uniref:hypothetical protein n=1 Tax=Nocardia sp. NPDC056000 TaxID=3345674 RepID=UPI0035E2959F
MASAIPSRKSENEIEAPMAEPLDKQVTVSATIPTEDFYAVPVSEDTEQPDIKPLVPTEIQGLTE